MEVRLSRFGVGGGWEVVGKSYAAPRAGDGIDPGHVELCVARLWMNLYVGSSPSCDERHPARQIF